MKIIDSNDSKRVIIDPGEFYVGGRDLVISTLLGSCVSACLYDESKGVIGMNHFLLAHSRRERETLLQSDEGRYGIYAMELLINSMMKHGANRYNLKAKCFGGGNVLALPQDKETRATVGDVNVQFIKEFLQQEHIPLVSSSLGGNHGRNVHFVGQDYSAYIQKINHAQQVSLEKSERRYWDKHQKHQDVPKSKAEFW